MHTFDDRNAILTIYTLEKPTRAAYKKTPPIVMSQSCGLSLCLDKTEAHRRNIAIHETGYTPVLGPSFFQHGQITCSDPTRHVSPGILFYCLIGDGERHIGADPDSYIYLPENRNRYLAFDYRPSPDDLLWKPYRITLSSDLAVFDFMALDSDGKLITASISFLKIAFTFNFSITYHNRNEMEKYDCRWNPISDYYSTYAPFHIDYELIFNTAIITAGIARRTIRYDAFPGLRPQEPVNRIRVYGKEVNVLD